MVFVCRYGFRFSSLPHRLMTDKITIVSTAQQTFWPLHLLALSLSIADAHRACHQADVDFSADQPGFLPQEGRQRVQATSTGVVHAALMTWEVYGDKDADIVMSTDPEVTAQPQAWPIRFGVSRQLLNGHVPRRRPATILHGICNGARAYSCWRMRMRPVLTAARAPSGSLRANGWTLSSGTPKPNPPFNCPRQKEPVHGPMAQSACSLAGSPRTRLWCK